NGLAMSETVVMPYVDFVDLDDCEPIGISLPGGSQATARILNREPVSGAVSAVVGLPASATLPAGYWSADLQLLVLDGKLRLGEERIERDGDQAVPAGVRVPAAAVGRDGVGVVVFASGAAGHSEGGVDGEGAPRHRMAGPIHAADIPWERPRVENVPAGAARK